MVYGFFPGVLFHINVKLDKKKIIYKSAYFEILFS